MITLALGCMPPTLNEMTNAARHSIGWSHGMKKKWTQFVVDACADVKPFKGDKLYLEFVYFVKNLARDPDNTHSSAKFVMDGLVNSGVISTDSLRVIQSPIIKWFEKVSDYDSVTVFLRNEREWKLRQKELAKSWTPIIVRGEQIKIAKR